MSFYIQHHNGERLGWVPLDGQPFLQTQLGIYTRLPVVQKAVGGTVFLIVSLGRPKHYYLWECFRVAEVRREGDVFFAFGPGWQLVPPQRLEGPAFDEFRKACASFIGFRRVDELPYRAQLQDLADRHRTTTFDDRLERFCDELVGCLPQSGDARFVRAFVRQRLGRNREALLDLDEAANLGTEFAEEAARCRERAHGA